MYEFLAEHNFFIVSFWLEIEKCLYLKRIAKFNKTGIRNAGKIGKEWEESCGYTPQRIDAKKNDTAY